MAASASGAMVSLDDTVLLGQARLRMLEEVVEAVEFPQGEEARTAVVREDPRERGEILAHRHLEIQAAAEGQDRYRELREVGRRIEGQEATHPGVHEGAYRRVRAFPRRFSIGRSQRGLAVDPFKIGLLHLRGDCGGLSRPRGQGVEPGVDLLGAGQGRLGRARGPRYSRGLEEEDIRAFEAGAREEDDEPRLGVLGGHDGRYEAALAVADDADAAGIGFRSGGEEIQGRLRVRGEIQAGRRAEAARGRGGAAVVIAQDRYAPAGEGVGDDEEGLVAEYGLVPVPVLRSP